MFVGFVAVEIGDVVVHLISREFAIGIGQGENFVATMLNCPAFVHIDVCTFGC